MVRVPVVASVVLRDVVKETHTVLVAKTDNREGYTG
jgi:hypothetical protein